MPLAHMPDMGPTQSAAAPPQGASSARAGCGAILRAACPARASSRSRRAAAISAAILSIPCRRAPIGAAFPPRPAAPQQPAPMPGRAKGRERRVPVCRMWHVASFARPAGGRGRGRPQGEPGREATRRPRCSPRPAAGGHWQAVRGGPRARGAPTRGLWPPAAIGRAWPRPRHGAAGRPLCGALPCPCVSPAASPRTAPAHAGAVPPVMASRSIFFRYYRV